MSVTSIDAFAQNKVSGKVTSDEGESLPGVAVMEKGTNNGVITDFDGNYSLTISSDAILVFKYLGFQTQEVAIGSKTVIDVALQTDLEELEEIVVIGYGTVKKSDLTGAVTSISAEDLTPGANISVEQMLQGRAPGVNISANTGEPGGGLSVQIRGQSSFSAGEPLYVVDGVPFMGGTQITSAGNGFTANPNARNPLNSINPNDIKSIEVLKDASATAIYGSRGSNGVVLITTKTGNSDKMNVNYSYSRSLQKIANEIEVLNPSEYVTVMNELVGAGLNADSITDFNGQGIDWAELLYRDGVIDEHNLSFSGGKNVNYYISLNAFEQEGVLINSGIKRYTFRTNLNTNYKDKLKLGVILNHSYIEDDYISSGGGINENAGALSLALTYSPIFPRVKDPFTGRFLTIAPFDNPLATAYHEQATQRSSRTFGSFTAEYFIIPSLSAKVKVGGDVSDARRDVFVGPETLNGESVGGLASIFNRKRTYHIGEFTLNYNAKFGKHQISAVAGTTYEEFNTFTSSAEGAGFIFPDLTTNAIGTAADSLEFVGSGRNQRKLNAVLGRVNYSLLDKYLFTVSIRADGSSAFGENNKIGYFPSAAIGWKLHEEPFMRGISQISELKVRASYGEIGNQQGIGDNDYLSSFNNGGGVVLGGNIVNTLSPSRNPNPNLQWESASQLDVGIDFQAFDGLVSGTVDYYERKTKDLLVALPQPTSTGFGIRRENIGSMINKGFEFSLTTYIIDKKDVQWEITGNLTTLKNEVLNIGGLTQIDETGSNQVGTATRTVEGKPYRTYFGHIIEGVWQEGDDFSSIKDNVNPGDWKYRDINGDSTINDADRTYLGDAFDDFFWGLTNTVTYKGLSLSIFLEGARGAKLLNQNTINAFYPRDESYNKLREPYLNRWTSDNPTNKYASFVTLERNGLEVNSKTVEDASYIRLQTVRLSYDVPVKTLGIKFISSINLFATGQNLITWTDYSGIDPAANSSTGGVAQDFSIYPFARTYTMGVNVGF